MTKRFTNSGRERTSNEWFSPQSLTIKLLDHLKLDLSQPIKVFEPAAGEGDMIAAFVEKMQQHGHSFDEACEMVTAVELFEDNAKIIKAKFPKTLVYCGNTLDSSTWKEIK